MGNLNLSIRPTKLLHKKLQSGLTKEEAHADLKKTI